MYDCNFQGTDFPKFIDKTDVLLKFEKIKGIVGEELFRFMIISSQFLLGMRNVLDKIAEKIKAHILRSITFSRKSCLSRKNLENIVPIRQATDNTLRRKSKPCVRKTRQEYRNQLVIFNAHSVVRSFV